MTLLPSIQHETRRRRFEHERERPKPINVGKAERAVSVAAGSILALEGLSRMSLPGLLVAGIGGAMIQRGLTGQCAAYSALGVNTAREEPQRLKERGIHIEQAFIINGSPEELYSFWHNFENLPRIMTHLKEVTVAGNRSHWIAEAPSIAGGKAEWDAEITADEPGRRIAWRSLPGSQVDCIGEIRFSKAMGDRGTEVHVFLDYQPPAGKLGHYIATLFGENPRRQMRDDLRNFKALMETGEIPTIAGQPRGTCLGTGKREMK